MSDTTPNKKLLTEEIIFEPDNSLLVESINSTNKPFLVKGILQRKGTKNQNGRIYPDEVLEREINNYKKIFVNERRALGELDHSNCLTKTAQILTKDGWKFIKDISNNEEVLTLNFETKKPEYQRITNKVDQPYEGTIYKIFGKNINTLVTPNHRFVVEDRYGKLSFKNANELYELNNSINTHLKIPKSNLCWDYNSEEEFILKGVDVKNKRYNKLSKEKYKNDVKIKSDVWMSFMGIWLAEGHCNTTRRDGQPSKFNSFGVSLCQKNKEKTEKIKQLLEKFPEEIKWKYKTTKSGITQFSTTDARLWSYLSPLGSCYTKYIPKELKNQSTTLLECILDWFHMGDGRSVNDRGYLVESVFSTSQRLIEDLQEIQLKCGGNGNIVIQAPTKDHILDGRIVKASNTKPLYVLKFNKSQYIHIDNRFLSITKEEFNDRVYCVQVPNQTFYCRDNGQCFWSGNSEVINLKNVSHNIVDMNWNGDELWGTVEILTTPCGNILRELFRNKIKVGISSRGTGTLKKGVTEGTSIVGDDYSLVCFDFVSNPSTVNAFMAPIMEGVSNPKLVMNKWVKTEEIIKDILNELI